MTDLVGYISDTETLSIRKQCELLGVSRSNLYYEPLGESAQNLAIMRLLDQEFMEHPTHGVLQMQDFLISKGFIVNEKRVRRLLRKMGILAIYPKRNLSKLGLAKYIRAYLLRGLEITKSNHVWEIDITYIPMKHGFLYLFAIIDVYSRYVVGWDVFNTLAAQNALNILKKAIKAYGMPQIINSDQGSQFTCPLWIEFIENQTTCKISMDGKGRALDNVFIERFWRTLKQDYVYLYPADNGKELFNGIQQFIEYYNNKKPHQGIQRQIPATIYLGAF